MQTYRRVVLTGAAGFIGSHLVEKFLSQDTHVVGVDNFLTGSPRNLKPFESEPRFTLIEADVSQPQWAEKISGPVDAVLHFACPASPADFDRLPLQILQVDSLGTFHALELARKKQARFIVASTSEVYGDPLVHPQTEDYWGNVNPIGPRACYDEVKRFSEAATMTYHRHYSMNTGIVRIFNTYGPRMRPDDGRVVPNFCVQALQGKALTVYGEGQQTRSFCFVDDLVDGIHRLALSAEHFPVNIGNPDEYTILKFAQIIQQLSHTSSEIEYRPLPKDDPKQRKPDITRARKILGWEPRVSLEAGLEKTLSYFKSVMDQT